MVRFLLLLFCFALVQGSGFACLWDRDTLGYEARQFPDVVQVITGRFERNPPLFYEMRLKRVAAELDAHPERLDLYDDAGVAADRLGRSDEALTWMTKKLARLESLPDNRNAQKDHWYRYYANVGTFRVHHWIKAGGNRGRLREVQQARDEIVKALQINPEAHFGREKYQLLVLEWIIQLPTKLNQESQPQISLASYLDDKEAKPIEIIKALSGLVVLGNAWESVDVYHALSVALSRLHSPKAGYLAELRMEELKAMGRRSLIPDQKWASILHETHFVPSRGIESEKDGIKAWYGKLREEANTWHSQRTAYLSSQLKAGRHPDTDPEFWKDYRTTEPPVIPVYWMRQILGKEPILSGGMVLIIFFIVLYVIERVIKKRRKRKQMPHQPLRLLHEDVPDPPERSSLDKHDSEKPVLR